MELESAKDLLRKIKGGRQEEPSDHSECTTPVEGEGDRRRAGRERLRRWCSFEKVLASPLGALVQRRPIEESHIEQK